MILRDVYLKEEEEEEEREKGEGEKEKEKEKEWRIKKMMRQKSDKNKTHIQNNNTPTEILQTHFHASGIIRLELDFQMYSRAPVATHIVIISGKYSTSRAYRNLLSIQHSYFSLFEFTGPKAPSTHK